MMRKKYISPELLIEDLRIDGNLLDEVSWSYITPDPKHDYNGSQLGGSNGAKGTTPGSLWEDESEEDAPKKDHF